MLNGYNKDDFKEDFNRLGNDKNTGAFLERSRAWQITLNNTEKYDNLKEELTTLKTLKYFISCKEIAPTTGHEHIHIYANFKDTYKPSKKALSYGAHWEKCRGSPKQNIDYIKKDGCILDEIGEEPKQGIKTVKELHEANINDLPWQMHHTKKEIDREMDSKEDFFNMLKEHKNKTLEMPEIYYITGPPGKGKTSKAYDLVTERWNEEEIGKITLDNGFAAIVNETAKAFVIEEFKPSQIDEANFLQLTDRYGASVNVKGGFVYLRPKALYICSTLPPQHVYRGATNKQFLRRITKIIEL